MSDALHYNVDKITLEVIEKFRRGESFFYNDDAFTVCKDHMLYRTCYRHRDSTLHEFPCTLTVRRVDIHSTVDEWSGPAEDDPMYDPEHVEPALTFEEDTIVKTEYDG
jgi:hypothetical protein